VKHKLVHYNVGRRNEKWSFDCDEDGEEPLDSFRSFSTLKQLRVHLLRLLKAVDVEIARGSK